MYIEIGAFAAKAHLSQLLKEVKDGKHYTITIRGEPVADLIPSTTHTKKSRKAAIEALEKMPKIKNVASKNIKEWIEEGRR